MWIVAKPKKTFLCCFNSISSYFMHWTKILQRWSRFANFSENFRDATDAREVLKKPLTAIYYIQVLTPYIYFHSFDRPWNLTTVIEAKLSKSGPELLNGKIAFIYYLKFYMNGLTLWQGEWKHETSVQEKKKETKEFYQKKKKKQLLLGRVPQFLTKVWLDLFIKVKVFFRAELLTIDFFF